MKIEVLMVPDCPNASEAVSRVREALTIAGVDADVTERVIVDADQASTSGMTGSPTILVDGHDPFATGVEPSLSCRLYHGPDGLSGSPTVEQLVDVLR